MKPDLLYKIAIFAIAAYVLSPFWAPLSLAAFTVVAVEGAFRRMSSRIGGKPAVVLIILGLLFLLGFPIYQISADFGKEVEFVRENLGRLADAVRETPEVVSEAGFSAEWTQAVKRTEAAWGRFTRDDLLGQALGWMSGVGPKLLTLLFDFAVYLSATTLLLMRRKPLSDLIPATRRTSSKRVVEGVFFGVVLLGAAEGLALGAAYSMAGIPAAFGTGLLLGMLAFIPLLSVAIHGLLCLAVAQEAPTWLWITLLSWGLFVLLVVDGLARPLLLSARSGMSGPVGLLGLLGGLATMGPPGLFIGPLALSLAKAEADNRSSAAP